MVSNEFQIWSNRAKPGGWGGGQDGDWDPWLAANRHARMTELSNRLPEEVLREKSPIQADLVHGERESRRRGAFDDGSQAEAALGNLTPLGQQIVSGPNALGAFGAPPPAGGAFATAPEDTQISGFADPGVSRPGIAPGDQAGLKFGSARELLNNLLGVRRTADEGAYAFPSTADILERFRSPEPVSRPFFVAQPFTGQVKQYAAGTPIASGFLTPPVA